MPNTMVSAMRFLRPTIFILLCCLTGAMLIGAPALADKKDPDAEEIRMGKEAAQELEKQYKLVTDEALNAKVNAIGQELAKIANETQIPAIYGKEKGKKFEYIFKILDDKDINALSMPGGFVYINKGLIDYTQSDDELAGVIAHEIAHIKHHHMMDLIKEQAKANNQLAAALVVALLGKANATDMGNILMGARFIQIAKLNGYSRRAEEDADMTGLALLSKSQYNPVGMLTFMERLARDELGKPNIQWGVYQTHPYPRDRSRALEAKLLELGIEINRRAVTKTSLVEARPAEGKEGVFEVWIGKRLFFTAASGDSKSAETRAKELAAKLDELLSDGLAVRDIRQTLEPPVITAKGEILLEVTDADAALFAPKSTGQIAREAYQVLYRVLFDQDFERIY